MDHKLIFFFFFYFIAFKFLAQNFFFFFLNFWNKKYEILFLFGSSALVLGQKIQTN